MESTSNSKSKSTKLKVKTTAEEPCQQLSNSWLQCVCLLKFDHDKGQVMEHVYPPSSLHEKEESDITNLAFPESNSLNCEGDLKFAFRLRHHSTLPLTSIAPCEQHFSFGFTLFSQRKDTTMARGYIQRSLAIVTDLYFAQFFYELVDIIASKCF